MPRQGWYCKKVTEVYKRILATSIPGPWFGKSRVDGWWEMLGRADWAEGEIDEGRIAPFSRQAGVTLVWLVTPCTLPGFAHPKPVRIGEMMWAATGNSLVPYILLLCYMVTPHTPQV